ncbi:hypothetical protein Pmani_016167 [Petrolisthes manimaculis]|uniref:Uncharacterized protein n=1 Tax=Petrolisthes manimaculis TaxID=1843537 RepID=A0AAE1PSV4_9EUCA|nr:hypothetical protein Pmani_016167 [Petrolisthes manimaculis]
MDTENTASKEECEKICQNNARCNAYAISEFEANCILYDNDRSNLPVKFNNYILYVLRLMEKDGYYVHKTDYYKLFTKRMTAHRAAEYCKNKEQGTLATVKSEKVNNLLLARIVEHNVWTAFIGVSDIEKEEDWRYADGSEVDYSNWSTSGGKWPSVRRDCAIITITGEWKHADCWHKDFFICQIPMF